MNRDEGLRRICQIEVLPLDIDVNSGFPKDAWLSVEVPLINPTLTKLVLVLVVSLFDLFLDLIKVLICSLIG